MPVRLILIRHGMTEWNKAMRYCGYKDVSLSSHGRVQSAQLRNALMVFKCDRIYSSDRKRALQTSRIVFNRDRIIKIRALREVHFGPFEGLSHQEIMKKYADVYKKWLKDPFKNRIPGAEPMSAFKKRIQTAIKGIIRFNRGKTVAVICHGGVIAMLISAIFKSRNFWKFIPSAASITIVEYKRGKPRIKRFNDISHLGQQ